jgi:putative ABC transport system substrate-binding protein
MLSPLPPVTGAFLDLPDFNAKSLQILCEAVPILAKAAVLWNPASGSLQLKAVRNAASTLSVTLEVFEVSRPSDFESTFQAVARAQVGRCLDVVGAAVRWQSAITG